MFEITFFVVTASNLASQVFQAKLTVKAWHCNTQIRTQSQLHQINRSNTQGLVIVDESHCWRVWTKQSRITCLETFCKSGIWRKF